MRDALYGPASSEAVDGYALGEDWVGGPLSR